MLLNVSHEITNCGLPQHIQDRYVRYKQGNRAIVAWMTRYGPDKYKGRKTLPIKQMITLGRILCDKVQEIGSLPSDVDYYFRDVIRERGYLSQHFRTHRDQCEKDEIDTINHEHFTESLKQIHEILLTTGKPSHRATAKKNDKRRESSSSSVALTMNALSRFSLSIEHSPPSREDSDDDSLSDADTNATSECCHSPLRPDSCSDNDPEQCEDFLDAEGAIGQGVEVIMFLDKIEAITEAIRSCWSKAGVGEAQVAASAAYTNVLIRRAIRYSREFVELEPEASEFQNMKQRIGSWTCENDPSNHQQQHQNGTSELVDTLCYTEELLSSTLTHGNSQLHSLTLTAHDTLVQKLVTELPSVLDVRSRSEIICEGVPGIDDLGNTFDTATTSFVTCIIIYLLSASHCAYSKALPTPNRITLPRISSLKLANEALSTIRILIDDKSIFPCQCVNTLGYRIAQMRDELETFAKYRCWNTLIQSPLVAGNHALEILDLCSYYGMHLFHYRQYVGAVLHTYNALVHLNILAPIPALELVCSLFAPVLYATGARPDAGFMASWLRYIGARLKFRTGRTHRDHKDTWCMSVPAHAAARSAGLNIEGRSDAVKVQPKFDYGTIDPTMKLKHDGWILSIEEEEQLDQMLHHTNGHTGLISPTTTKLANTSNTVAKSKKSKHARTKSCIGSKVPATNANNPEPDSCSNLLHTINSTFTTEPSTTLNLPPSRFNLISFFLSMTRIISGISDATHSSPSPASTTATPSADNGKGQMCLCFTQTILRASDRILDVRKRSGIDAKGAVWSKNEKECIECFKGHLATALEEAGVLEGQQGGKWLWESVM